MLMLMVMFYGHIVGCILADEMGKSFVCDDVTVDVAHVDASCL